MTDHVRIEVATFAGIDLNSLNAGFADAVCVIGRLLIAFNYAYGVTVFNAVNGFSQ